MNNSGLEFGSKQVGDTQRPGAQSITIENKEAVSLTNLQIHSVSSSYEIGSTSSSIAPGEKKSFTIQPKSDLPIGSYHETFVITAEPEGKVRPMTITAFFEVKKMDTCAAPAAAPTENTPTTPYASNQNVTLTTATEDADIYYTTDNSEPTLSSAKYTAPIPVSGTPGQSVTTTIKAIAVKTGMKNSTVKTFSYTIKLDEIIYSMDVAPKNTDFGSKQEGYVRPEANTIMIENTGNATLTNLQVQPQKLSDSSYEIGGSSLSSIEPGEKASFTLQPKSGLPVGQYEEEFEVTAGPVGSVSPITVTASFKVIKKAEKTYTLSVQNGTGSGSYKKGEAVTVSANVPAGKEFKQWKVTRGNLTLSDIYQAILHFFMPEEDIALSAEFRDADPNPDPTPNPASTEPSDNGEHKSHTCDFHWVTVTEATSSADGEEVYQCSVCGDITARQAISAFGSYCKELLDKIKNAKQGETLEISTDTWMSFPAYILKALEERPDLTLTVTFRYEGKHYRFTIPARKAGNRENVLTETDPVTGEIVNWYGFLYLSEKYGGSFEVSI